MIGEIKEIPIGDKKYELVRKGVNSALTVQSIFLELISKTKIDQDKNISERDLDTAMLIGMRGPVLEDIKDIIIDCVASPKMTSDTYDELKPEEITQLFMRIYYFLLSEADKKKEPPP